MSYLYIVPTPIGNLEDISYRSVNILKVVNFILAEDTRTTSNLLRHLQINKPIYSFHKFNEHRVVEGFIQKILSGEQAALVSDAGTPGISDPGYLLVREAIQAGVKLTCLPGPTALIPAIVMSGLPSERFCFEGFLPLKKGRNKRLSALANEERTMIFYESPFRVRKTLEQFVIYFGGKRRASVSREISKVYEETLRGTLEELYEIFKVKDFKGEFVICVEGKREEETS